MYNKYIPGILASKMSRYNTKPLLSREYGQIKLADFENVVASVKKD
jgi:hypothetical protein